MMRGHFAYTDTLIGDADGIYHPALFNDRLLLGLKGAMSEAELHVLRARLNGGIRNKAARGELRRGLPVGFRIMTKTISERAAALDVSNATNPRLVSQTLNVRAELPGPPWVRIAIVS